MGSCTRRELLLLAGVGELSRLPLARAESVRSFPSDLKKLTDPATEFPIIRLTGTEYNSRLPWYTSRFIARKSNFLLYASDRSESRIGIYKLDVRTGESTLLADGASIEGRFAALTPDDRGCYFADGDTLFHVPLSGGRPREVYRTAEGWRRSGLPAITEDGIAALWPEQKDQTFRIRLVSLMKSSPGVAVEAPEPVSEVAPRPRRAGFMYRRGAGQLWLASFDGQQNYRLKIAGAPFSYAQWTAEGRTILYLSKPAAPGLVEIREFTPDTNEDKLVSKTSQYAAFGHNADASVFIGASGSRASPYLFLMIRSVQRELALAEHKASEPGTCMPVFSPNSHRVFFETDRDGHSCLYSMIVDKLVEETEP